MSRFTRVLPVSSRSRHGVPVCHLSGPKKETDNKQCTDKWFSFEKVMMVFLSFPCFHNMFFANFVRYQTILQIFPWFHILCNWHISKFYNFTNAVQLVGFEDHNNGHIIVRSCFLIYQRLSCFLDLSEPLWVCSWLNFHCFDLLTELCQSHCWFSLDSSGSCVNIKRQKHLCIFSELMFDCLF